MNLKTRLAQLERQKGPARTRYVWLDSGETEAEALARLGIPSRHDETVVAIGWMTEPEAGAHGHA